MLRLTVENTYPSDKDPVPLRIHEKHLIRLNIRPGDSVQLTADDGISITSDCQRNDHVPVEEGLIRLPPTLREELGVSIGDTVIVSPSDK
jgi:antitoxin component of MazEF toxin-antitoxin module